MAAMVSVSPPSPIARPTALVVNRRRRHRFERRTQGVSHCLPEKAAAKSVEKRGRLVGFHRLKL
jgi:hypothetical protein